MQTRNTRKLSFDYSAGASMKIHHAPPRCRRFDKIGLIRSMYAPWSGYGDLGAGGRVAHRIALNTWQGAGVPPRPPGMAGMRSFTMRFESRERLMEAVARIGNTEPRDPDANLVVLV